MVADGWCQKRWRAPGILELISGRVSGRSLAVQRQLGATVRKPSVFLTNRRRGPAAAGSTQSQRSCVELRDLASVSNIVRSVSNSVRRMTATVSSNVRQKQALIARRAIHHCASPHLGVETQRQWSDQAIARTIPYLLGLFSIVTLLATRLGKRSRLAVADAAWYRKQQPTFADTLAAVRREIWATQGFSMSRSRPDSRKFTQRLGEGIIHSLCNAA
jgi:hypothetical protein